MGSKADHSYEEVLSFWFQDCRADPDRAVAMKARWFGASDELDQEIQRRFEAWIAAAADGKVSHWKTSAHGRLALTLLLDQFPRNIYRGTSRAFTHDAAALEISNSLIERGLFELSPPEQVFAVLPLTHSEALADQERALEVFDRCVDCSEARWRPLLAQSREFARDHHNVIARFGRFPHRNAALGRTSTRDEELYLIEGPEAWGQ